MSIEPHSDSFHAAKYHRIPDHAYHPMSQYPMSPQQAYHWQAPVTAAPFIYQHPAELQHMQPVMIPHTAMPFVEPLPTPNYAAPVAHYGTPFLDAPLTSRDVLLAAHPHHCAACGDLL